MDTTEIDFNRVNSLSAEGPVELNGQKTVHELLSYQQNKVEVSCKFSTLGAYYEKNRNNMINSATQSSNANSSRNRNSLTVPPPDSLKTKQMTERRSEDNSPEKKKIVPEVDCKIEVEEVQNEQMRTTLPAYSNDEAPDSPMLGGPKKSASVYQKREAPVSKSAINLIKRKSTPNDTMISSDGLAKTARNKSYSNQLAFEKDQEAEQQDDTKLEYENIVVGHILLPV